MSEKQNKETNVSEDTVETPVEAPATTIAVNLNPYAARMSQFRQNVSTGKRIAVIAGRDVIDPAAVQFVLETIKETNPGFQLVTIGQYAPDKLVMAVARNLGIRATMAMPKIVDMQRSHATLETPEGESIVDELGRLLPKFYDTYGKGEATLRSAAQCAELHIIGQQEGPQRAWNEAFTDAGKNVIIWGDSDQNAPSVAQASEELAAVGAPRDDEPFS